MHTASVSYSDNGKPQFSTMGKHNILAVGIQGFNNARTLATGSIDMLSNELYSKSKGSNQAFINNLVSWLVHERGEVKKLAHNHICVDKHDAQVECPVRSFFKFSIDVQINFG